MPVSDNFIFKEINDEYMLIPISNGNVDMSRVFNLNEIGAIVYKGLRDGMKVSDIIDKICLEYDAPREVVTEDVDEFITQLKSRGIYNE